MALAHEEIVSTLEIKISTSTPLNMQTIADAIRRAYPNDPTIIPIGIAVPGICITNCNAIGVIDAENDVNDAASRIYNAGMQAIYQPVWTALYEAYQALKHFGLGVIDLTLPYFGLHISDLFDPNFYCKLYDIIAKLFPLKLDFLKNIFKALGIPWPFYNNFDSIQEKIKYIVRSIWQSLWDQLLKKINTIKDLIQKGLALFDTATYKVPTLSVLWKKAVDQILASILKYLKEPPSLQQILDDLKAFAKKILKKAEVTAQDILKAIKNFKLPFFGKPWDWLEPFSKHTINPEKILAKLVSDIGLWIKNFIANIILKFVEFVLHILEILGIKFKLPTLKIPITLCVIRVKP